MSDYFEWTPTEEQTFDLMIWWATREPYTHTEDCEGVSLHCCDSPPEYYMGYGLQLNPPPEYENMNFVYPDGIMVPMDAGDRIYYDGKGVYRLEKK